MQVRLLPVLHMATRRGFLRNLTMASIAMALPDIKDPARRLTVGGPERFRITASGNVLIGVTDSSSKLFIHGNNRLEDLGQSNQKTV